MRYTDSVWAGEGIVPIIPRGTLAEDLFKILKEAGYKKVKTGTITLTDDYLCSSPNPEERKDNRLRVS
jgi:hypothetical protein